MDVRESGYSDPQSYAPVEKTPVLKENLARDHLSAMSGITLEGRLYMTEQEKAFKGGDVVRFPQAPDVPNPW